MKKIVTVLGARPQFIKAAAVGRELARSTVLSEIVVHTGQHYSNEMSALFFQEMDIPPPQYNLSINQLSHGAMTGRMVEHIEEVLLKEKPDAMLVYGDTNSTLAGALAAVKLQIPVAHVEAGLRSYNMAMPEEVNRILTDRVSSILFCPTKTSVNNLQREGFSSFDCTIHLAGDVMFDTALYYGQRSAEKSAIVKNLSLKSKSFVLCTLHRQENTDDPQRLRSIMEALDTINQSVRVVMPLHPRTQAVLKREGIVPAFDPINPVGYFDMVELYKHCQLVITDSGGVQKEAWFFGKFCVTLRDQTEWAELVEEGVNILTGADTNAILSAFSHGTDKKVTFNKALYGEGNASALIRQYLEEMLQQ